MVGAFRFPFGMVGKIGESTTLKFSNSITRHSASVTAKGSDLAPIRHVDVG